ncbi:MAG: T9SS type A sorting domain-containing protein [Reichenbachiella sp.]
MKTTNYLLLIAVIMCTYSVRSFGQEARVVVIDGWDPSSGAAEDFNNVFVNAVNADTTDQGERHPNTIYELRRGHKYPQGITLQNFGYHLHIRAEEGDGLLPEFIPGLNTKGKYKDDYINSANDMTIENIVFNGFTPDGGQLRSMFEIRQPKSRAIIDGCIFYGDNNTAINLRADSVSLFIKNVTAGNAGNRKSAGGNGRFVDIRPEALFVDTLSIENSTIYNGTDRVLRNMGSIIGYIKIDHLTALNTLGYHGGVQLGVVRNATVKNSLFSNVISLGHSDFRIDEQTHPAEIAEGETEAKVHLAVITLDAFPDTLGTQSIVIKNNNMVWTQPIKDVWAKYDTVSAPNFVSSLVTEAVGEGNVEGMYFSEELELTNVCSDLNEYVDAFYIDPTAVLPENWCVGDGAAGIPFPDQIDAGYADTYSSYTGGDDGYPVGNLNYFPDLLAEWAGPVIAAIDDIELEIGNSSDVTVTVTDARGLEVAVTVSSSDDAVATVQYADGIASVTGLLEGIATITVSASNGEVVTEETFTTTVGNPPLAVGRDLLGNGITVYPNPTSNGMVTFNNSELKIESLTVLNMTGQKMKSYTFTSPNVTETIDLSTFGKGIFFLKTNLGTLKVINQ